MRLHICAIGKKRGAPESALVDDYLKRIKPLGRGVGITGAALADFDAPKSLSGDALREKEGALLLKAVPDGARVIVLDERGDNLSSEKFARFLATLRAEHAADAAFLIGGADGHGAAVKARASRMISFGAATWPHMLVRVMLAEQLYRAVTILSGHPYHRS